MSSDALELALALHQAPIRRFSLRDRPLPENIDEVLQLASAMQPQLQAAAARVSESEETIVEAVRFYLQQILFEPGTDAYRIFGVEPDADFKQVRQHHIWLQRWLHPDRRGEHWEAALATKVNWAWQRLHNESSREKYDHSRQQFVVQDALDPATMAPVQVRAWSAAPSRPSRDWLRRMVVGSLLALCVGVFYLASTRQDRVDPDVLAALADDAGSGIRPRLPFNGVSRGDAEQPASNPVTVTSTSNGVDSAAVKASAVAQSGQLVPAASVAPIPVDNRFKPKPFPEIAGKSKAALSLEAPGRTGAMAPPTAGPVAARRTAGVKLAHLSSAGTDGSEMSPRQRRRAARAALRASNRATAAASALEPVMPVEEISLTNGDTRSALVQGNASANGDSDTVAAAKTTGLGNSSAAESQAAAEVASTVEQPMLVNEIGRSVPVGPDASNINALADVPRAATRPSAPAQQVQSAAAPQTPTAELERATLVRFELARARVRSMVSYFGSANTTPPTWNDESGRTTAARERKVLHQRSGELGIDRFVLDPPAWQISHSAVSLNASYHVNAKRTSAESGRLRLDMVWKHDSWKITHIELSPES